MENIFNKAYNKPSELFTDACVIISNILHQYGFKYLKSKSEIKKTHNNLLYLISFYSSSNNYIEENSGHVVMGMGCFIKNKKNNHNLFSVMQKTLLGVYEYELYDNGKINKQSIEIANDFIEHQFLSKIIEIENNANDALEKISKMPANTFDDYWYRYEKEIFEIFCRNDLISEYEKNIQVYDNNKIKRQEADYQKYIEMIGRIE
jgi:hypothetical protein